MLQKTFILLLIFIILLLLHSSWFSLSENYFTIMETILHAKVLETTINFITKFRLIYKRDE